MPARRGLAADHHAFHEDAKPGGSDGSIAHPLQQLLEAISPKRDKAALLVVMGAMRDGTKEVLAIAPGYRESTESWSEVFRDLKARGLGSPRLLMADGNAAIWGAARQVWPEAAEQRCWNHKMRNVLDRLPQREQGEAKDLLRAVVYPFSNARRTWTAQDQEVGYHDELELVSFRPQRLYSTFEETLSVEVDHQVGQLVEDPREPAGTPPPDPSFAPFRGASQAHG